MQEDGAVMKIEDIIIEDAADANYFIRKFCNNDLKNLTMNQLEQLVLAVYTMGKNSGVSGNLEPDEIEPKPALEVIERANPFKINERVNLLEDVEIGSSGEFLNKNSVGTVTIVKGDTVTVLFEADEDGEMIEVNVLFDKLEKAS
jgi:hypothetical protein